jgi:hypothetical protein
MISECVLDSNLVCKFKENGIYCKNDLGECIALSALLHEITQGRSKLVLNKEIRDDYYLEIFDCHAHIRRTINYILSNDACKREIDNCFIDRKISEHFDTTPLNEKMHYISAACQCSYKALISTEEFVHGVSLDHRRLLHSETQVTLQHINEVATR